MLGLHRGRAAVGVLTLWLLGGLTYPMLTVASKHLVALELVSVRSSGSAILATLLVLVVMPNAVLKLRFDARLFPVLIASVVFYPIGQGTLAIASSRIPSAVSALIFSCLPVLTVLYALTRRERQSGKTLVGVVLAVLFVGLLAGGPEGAISRFGFAAVVFSVITWFMGTEYWIRYKPDYPMLISVWLMILFGAIECDLMLVVSGKPLPSPRYALTWYMLTLIVFLVAQHTAYIYIASRVSGPILTSFAFVNPLVSATAAYFMFGERFSALQAAAGFGLLLAIYLVVSGAVLEPSQHD
jgi:drug/metabolite transporter (DMT)-like permease